MEDNNEFESDVTEQTQASASGKRPFKLSIIAMAIGVLAIGVAVIPSYAFDRPLANPFADPEREKSLDPPIPEPKPEREGGITFRIKDFSVNLGGKVPEKPEEVEEVEEDAPTLQLTKDPFQVFNITAAVLALVGMVAAAFAHMRENHGGLTMCTVVCCLAAITWQYFAVGIAVGVGVVVIIVLLANIGSALS